MKKISILILITLVFGACSNDPKPEDIQNKIFEYKEKITELENQLDTLKENKKTTNTIFVKVKVVKPEKLTHYIKTTAYIQAKKHAYVSPEMSGQIKHIYVKEGQYVKKGRRLAALSATVLRSNIDEVKTGLALATTLYDKQKSLREQKVGKELDYLQAKNKKESLEAKLRTLNAQLAMTVITAPISGIVDEIYLKEGEAAAPGRQVINLINLQNMEAEADVSEKYLPNIHKGDSVLVSFPAYPGLLIKTKISRTGNEINSVNRTFKTSVDFRNIDNKLKPNMIAELRLSDYSGENLSVPSIIVKKDTKGDYLFIAEEKEGHYTAKKIYVQTSYLIDDQIIIAKGLKSGDKVITDGYNLISNNQNINIK